MEFLKTTRKIKTEVRPNFVDVYYEINGGVLISRYHPKYGNRSGITNYKHGWWDIHQHAHAKAQLLKEMAKWGVMEHWSHFDWGCLESYLKLNKQDTSWISKYAFLNVGPY